MYCQSCGASNSDDAKFCNQCGGRIAQPGDVGGPAAKSPGATVVGVGAPVTGTAPPAAPAAAAAGVNVWEQQATSGAGGGPSMMSVSLDAIGVRSTKRVWAGIVIAALLLVALGALGSWLLRGEPEVVAEAGHAQPEDPFVIGTPLPSGEEPAVEAPTGEGEGASSGSTSTAMGGATTMSTTSSGTMSSTTTMTSAGSTGSTTTMGSTTTGSTTGSTMGSTTTGSTTTTMDTSSTGSTTTMETSGTTTMDTSGSTMDTTTESPTTMETTGGGTDLGGDLPEERDLELELYGSRVRFVVQRYYAARAQGCFDRATRNNPNVSGTVVVSMTIGAEGAVTETRIVRNTTGDEVLGNCLRSQVASWQLPPPPGGSLDMQMPFSR